MRRKDWTRSVEGAMIGCEWCLAELSGGRCMSVSDGRRWVRGRHLVMSALLGTVAGVVCVAWLLPRQFVVLADASESLQTPLTLLAYSVDGAIIVACCMAVVAGRSRGLPAAGSAVWHATAGLVGGGLEGLVLTVAVAGLLHFRTDGAVVALEFAIAASCAALGICLGAVRWALRADLAGQGAAR